MALAGDTIAAIATAPGRGGVAVIRVSGPDAFAIAERLTGRPVRIGRAVFARIRQPISFSPNQTRKHANTQPILDEGLVLSFRAPHSYTGEDVVELQCHGGTVTPRRILEACFAAGARLARRGEFTQRAFLNGRMDYDQAESVLDLIDAKTARAADVALEGLSGRRRQRCRDLYEAAVSLGVELEHALDVDEDELPSGFVPNVTDRLAALRLSVDVALRQAREGKILRNGALVVLSGPPNVGKSSLMNALLEENRAIVSDVAGTTRDSIEEWLDLDGWPIRLVDTAGLRETGDAVEAEGVRRAEELAASADVLLRLTDATAPVHKPDDERTLNVLAKCDLVPRERRFERDGVWVSSRTGEGLDELKRALSGRIEKTFAAQTDAQEASDETFVQSLIDARTLLSAASAAGEGDLVVIANVVRSVGEKLGEAIGVVYSAELLDRLFDRFCVGK